MAMYFRTSYKIIVILVVMLLAVIHFYMKSNPLKNVLLFMKIEKPIDNWHMNVKSPENLTFLSPYRGSWLNGSNNCSCNIGALLPLTKSYDPKDLLAIKKRRKQQYEQHRKRTESPLKKIITSQPNSPLSYPIHGVEVMPLQSIVIPGLGVFAFNRQDYKVGASPFLPSFCWSETMPGNSSTGTDRLPALCSSCSSVPGRPTGLWSQRDSVVALLLQRQKIVGPCLIPESEEVNKANATVYY
ncbi:beta-1,4 N-acetylgalactosaminyltransferase 2-like [Rhincodon typus]|uniref:beta-1,4 N-acetylgalactosaminyltransferase 2-like n=1 Tax=Rhincodon typus TaxID=259920 RepID=UPI002030C3AC|nr:beta-1,4 N-acetylgalactosaminyltransferase 2-like [Rhincodon typus]